MAGTEGSSDALTLAVLRRRGRPRRPAPEHFAQPDLFAGLTDPTPSAPPSTLTAAPVHLLSFAEPAPASSSNVPQPERSHSNSPQIGMPTEVTASASVELSVTEPIPTRSHPLPSAPFEELVDEEPSTDPPLQTWSVSGLVRHVRGLVERGYGQVTVEGEISNWRPAGSGHCYFTLKDAGSQLSAVLFRRQASLLRFRPSDGDAVKLHGQLSIYESRGQMQLIVEWIEQVGLGAMLAAVQRLKERLRREGLFDRKRPLPPFPRCIGVVTSLHGAALRDIVKVCRRRHAAVQLLIYPAAVQGPNCAAEIAAGLRWFDAHTDRAEVVLVARGGGSWEDLHGFDDERIARAIAASLLPVITGIGHATDSTIADAAADLCAPTPSAAAELLTSAQHRVEERIAHLHSRLTRACDFELLRSRQRLAHLAAGNVLRRVQDTLNRRAQRVDELGFRNETALRRVQRTTGTRLSAAEAGLARQNPTLRLQRDRSRLDALHHRLERSGHLRLVAGQRRTEAAGVRLAALSPLRVLDRGYALVYGADGHLLRDAGAAQGGEEILARLARGSVRARVLGGPQHPGTAGF